MAEKDEGLSVDELPLGEFELVVESALERLKSTHHKHAARNSFEHMRRAWALRRLDPEIAAFRAITAQEEAATALILALKHRSYPGAQLLNHRDHKHKVAILTTFHALRESLARHHFPEAQIQLSKVGPPKIGVHFDFAKLTGQDLPYRAELPEPFELYMSTKKKGALTAQVHDFSEELLKLAVGVGFEDFGVQIERSANRRNQLLYASDRGLPQSDCSDEYLISRARMVSAMAVVLIGILQTPKHQSLVVQCLEGLLRALNRVASLEFDYPDSEPSFPTFELLRQDDGKFKMRVPRRPYYKRDGSWGNWCCDWWPHLGKIRLT